MTLPGFVAMRAAFIVRGPYFVSSDSERGKGTQDKAECTRRFDDTCTPSLLMLLVKIMIQSGSCRFRWCVLLEMLMHKWVHGYPGLFCLFSIRLLTWYEATLTSARDYAHTTHTTCSVMSCDWICPILSPL